MRFDVVVVGAGPAGIAAAIEASRSGLKVALIERYGCVGGMLTQGHVGPIMGDVSSGTIAEEIERAIGSVKRVCFDFENAKGALAELLYTYGVEVFLQTVLTGAKKENATLKSIETYGKFGKMEFEADIFIDSTGDGDLAVACGCPWEMGRDSDGLVQPVTLMFLIDGVDPNQTLMCRHEEHYTDLGDGREYLDLCRKACQSGELPENVNIVRLYNTSKPTERMVNATQQNYVNPLKPEDVYRAEVSLRKQITKVVNFLKNNIPGFSNITVKGTPSTLGVRESRRIIGRTVLTEADLMSGRSFPDTVVHSAYFAMDIHNPSGAGQSENENACPKAPKPYDIPFSAMTALGCDNLITAGRCISGTHAAHSSYRVMRICMAMGQAAGAAAKVMHDTAATTESVNTDLIRKHLIDRGVKLAD